MSTNTSSAAIERTPPSDVKRGVLLGYGLPAFVISLPTIPIYIYLPAWYGVELGLGLAATGAILLGARLFDTVTDPLIGALSDRHPWRGHYRKPWIAAGAVIAGAGLFRLLNPPPVVDGTYLLTWSLVLYGGWTMVAVPYTAWGAELSRDYHARTRITAWREGFALLGIVGAGALTAGLARSGTSETAAVSAIAWMAIGLGIVSVPLLLWTVPDRGLVRRSHAVGTFLSWRDYWRTLAGNRPFLRLLSAWFLNGLANGIPAALLFLYLEHGLGAGPRDRAMFVLVYFVAAIAAIPMWLHLIQRFGKHRIWCWAMLSACAAFIIVPLIPAGGYAAFAVVCVVTGMALGADLALPPAIQADVVDYDTWRSGQARAGFQFALWGMATKLSLAVAVGLALPALGWLGFDPARVTESGRQALIVIYAVAPVVIKGAAVAVVWRFPLTPRKHAVIRRRLHQTKHRLWTEQETAP